MGGHSGCVNLADGEGREAGANTDGLAMNVVFFQSSFYTAWANKIINWVRIMKRLWNPGIDSAWLGIDSWAPYKVHKYLHGRLCCEKTEDVHK